MNRLISKSDKTDIGSLWLNMLRAAQDFAIFFIPVNNSVAVITWWLDEKYYTHRYTHNECSQRWITCSAPAILRKLCKYIASWKIPTPYRFPSCNFYGSSPATAQVLLFHWIYPSNLFIVCLWDCCQVVSSCLKLSCSRRLWQSLLEHSTCHIKF